MPNAAPIRHRIAHDQGWKFQFVRYLTIGGITFVVDLSLLKILLTTSLPLAGSVTVAYAVAIVTHFSLNKFANFRAHDRPVHRQMFSYGIIAVMGWLITLGAVELGVHRFGLPALGAKVIAVAITFPLGFVGNRFLTFGAGIRAAVRHLVSKA